MKAVTIFKVTYFCKILLCGQFVIQGNMAESKCIEYKMCAQIALKSKVLWN